MSPFIEFDFHLSNKHAIFILFILNKLQNHKVRVFQHLCQKTDNFVVPALYPFPHGCWIAPFSDCVIENRV